LLSNAVKYRCPNSTIHVEVTQVDGDARIAVMNRGTPIPPDELPQLFDRFMRAREARGSKPGVGLGLSICKGIVEAHGGRIWAESDEDSTRFYATLPLPHRAS
jgi:signal transduction histidine kinase